MSRAHAGLSNLAAAYPRPVALGAPMVFLFVLGLTLPTWAQLGPALAGRTAATQNAATVNYNPAGIIEGHMHENQTNPGIRELSRPLDYPRIRRPR